MHVRFRRMRPRALLVGALAVLVSCSASSGPSDDEILRYANELRECADKYVARGLSREAATYGPCAEEVRKIGE